MAVLRPLPGQKTSPRVSPPRRTGYSLGIDTTPGNGVFILILTLVASLMHGYLFWRIASLPWVGTHSRRKRLWGTALVLWLLYLVGVFFGHDGGGGWVSSLERLAMDWLGVLFIATTVMLSGDLLTGFGLWARPYLPRIRSGALLIAAAMIALALVQGMRPPVVVREEVSLAGLPRTLDGTRVAVLADLHLGSQLGADWLAARVKQVEALKPDLIVLLGDIFEGHGQPNPELAPLFRRLQAPLGVYAVTGNHEFHGDAEAAIVMTEKVGVVWLRDRWQEIAPGLVLAGVEDLSARWRHGEPIDVVSQLLQGRPAGATILLSHTSWQAEQAAAAGVGLMLSGHNHGGQIWPFGYLVRHFYPLFAGRYEVGGMSVIVSRGTGLWGPRMRLWRPGEILEVVLRAA